MPFQRILAATATLALSQFAIAGADCPKAPETQWMPVHELQKKIVNEYGFAIKLFKVDGNCYEIYGWEKSADGKALVKIEVYFNPVDGAIVKKKIED